jgi:serine/threonine protein phosphatase PrpC
MTDVSQHCEANATWQASFFGVYDGHGGRRAADFLCDKLHVFVRKAKARGLDVRGALSAALHEAEQEFNQIAEAEDLTDGTTAAVAIIDGAQLTVASVGDSELVLCRSGKALPLCEVHNPGKNPAEAQRVTREGGVLVDSRVAHPLAPQAYSLALSRAIGDFPFKSPLLTRGHPSGVSAEPDIRELQLTAEDEFLILACDGLWDVMTHQEAVDSALAALRASDDPQAVAEALVADAYARGSTDNISVLLVTLRRWPVAQASRSDQATTQQS